MPSYGQPTSLLNFAQCYFPFRIRNCCCCCFLFNFCWKGNQNDGFLRMCFIISRSWVEKEGEKVPAFSPYFIGGKSLIDILARLHRTHVAAVFCELYEIFCSVEAELRSLRCQFILSATCRNDVIRYKYGNVCRSQLFFKC